MNENKLILITGGARSGKSSFALREASNIPGAEAYIATAKAYDEEMRQRIENHQKQRTKHWDTFEEPIQVADVIQEIKAQYNLIVYRLPDPLVINIMQSNADVMEGMEKLVHKVIPLHLLCHVSILSPMKSAWALLYDNELARRFRDMAGLLNQRVAEFADEVYLMVSGIPLKVKG